MKAFLTAFDLLLITLAFLSVAFGLARQWSFWRAKKPADISGDWPGLMTSVLAHRGILKRQSVGRAHLAIFWGVMIPLMVIILAQFGVIIPQAPAHLLSLVQDLAGLALLIGCLFLLLRRFQSTEQYGPPRTLLPMFLLLVIILSGFLAAGARLSILNGVNFAWTSPMGWLFSLMSPASPLFMQMMIRLHFVAVLLLIGTLPFTFMRHALATPLNLFYRKKGPKGALSMPALDTGKMGIQTVEDLNWKQMLDGQACVACGRCDDNCPAALSGKPLSPRKVVQDIYRQMEALSAHRGHSGNGQSTPLLEDAITADEMWACTSCLACVTHCPAAVEPLDKIIDMRRHQVMAKARLPHEAQPMLRDLELYGDVQGKGRAHRTDWAMHREVAEFSKVRDNPETKLEYLLFVGCSGAFHPRNSETSRAMVKILKAAGIGFAILGTEEWCCGDPARRLGDENLFRKLAQANIERFRQYHVEKIVTMCPHCLNTLKNEYPDLGCELEVVHATELVAQLIREKRLDLKYPVAEKMALHDACYLGRYNQVYQPPREICEAVPGASLEETKRNRENGFCCGGGGGRMWLHENMGQNINVVRAAEMVKTEVDLIGTSCPYCLVMLDDGVKSLDLEKVPKVADIIDIVADSLG